MSNTRALGVLELTEPESGQWRELVSRHPGAGIFHTPGWMLALRRTFGYEPLILAREGADGELREGIPFFRVASPLTGHRIVSLPFSDHCEPLLDGADSIRLLLESSRFPAGLPVQVRPLDPVWGSALIADGWSPSGSFHFHELDLRPGPDALLAAFHKDCIRRKIRRAEREGLNVRKGNSMAVMRGFYHLHLMTRRRQGTPAQPWSWFRNLVDCLGSNLTVYQASLGATPVAAIVTLAWRDCLTYKYGASDDRYSATGGTPLVMWHAIQDACAGGLTRLDLGRTDLDNPGLAQFKSRWGARQLPLTYYQRPAPRKSAGLLPRLRPVLQRLPMPLFRLAGEVLYRHFG